ncbi:MAG: peptide chain release factor 1 [Gammaproteobacteria bacterium]|jgi:peptide chain release factor 1|nr:peptide chain release factor 1 [Gammaproteobacteria bacterium]
MQPSIERRLEGLSERLQELEALLAAAETSGDPSRFRELSREYAQVSPVVDAFRAWRNSLDDIAAAQEMLQDRDPEMRSLAQDELERARANSQDLASEVHRLLLPQDPRDAGNVFLEIRAGAGGDEAAIFAGDLFRMYSLYAEARRWEIEVLSANPGEHGGYREIISRIAGRGVYSRLKFESGTHRVQRVPATEAQGRIHTSTCTVAVLPEQEEVEEVEINPADLKIDTFRASGAGGQHVNKTDSAIRITHLPSGMVVECQQERSQHKNRSQAMSLLRARLTAQARDRQQAEQAQNRKLQVGTGDRSERIRTYNFPQGRLTDHRINLTLYRLDAIMEGNLDQIIDPLTSEHQAEQLATLAG